MSFTRVWQAGGELNTLSEATEYSSAIYGTTSNFTVSSTKARTGTYSFRFQSTSYPRGYSGVLTQFRAGFFINHTGLSSTSSEGVVFVVPCTGVTSCFVRWVGSTSLLELVVNGTVRDSVDVGVVGFSTTDRWYHVGVTYKADASTGFVSMYIDGLQQLSWTGNTGTQADGFYVAGTTSVFATGWSNYAYFDDLYVDSASSEADAAPPTHRLFWSPVSGAGTSAAWTAVGTTPNYACVDDTTPNDDTDYVSATSSGLIDYYATTNVTVPAGYTVAAVIPTVVVKRTDSGTDSQVKLGVRLSSTDSTNTAQSLPTAYGVKFERHTTKPGGGSWSETDVNNAEMMLESAGTF